MFNMPTYLTGILILALVWILFFALRKDLRYQLWFMSSISAVLGLTQLIYFTDYWNPDYIFQIHIFGAVTGIEDFLSSFFFGGIASIIYEVIHRRRITKDNPHAITVVYLLAIFVALFVVFYYTNIQSIWASSLALLVLAAFVLLSNKEIITDALWTSIYMVVLVIFGYGTLLFFFPEMYSALWFEYAFSSGITFINVPLEEIVWFFALGLAFGGLYEYAVGVRQYRRIERKSLK